MKKALLISVIHQILFLCILFLALKLKNASNFLDHFIVWDAHYYLKIAKEGYVINKLLAFPPLYPLLIKIASCFFSFETAGLIINNISAILGKAFFIHYLNKKNYNKSLIIKIVLLLLISPINLAYSIAYTEGLFLIEIVFYLHFLNKKKLLETSIITAFAILTKPTGLIFIVPLLSYSLGTKKCWLSKLKYLAPAVLALSLLLLISFNKTNNPLSFFIVEKQYWNKSFNFPLLSIINHIKLVIFKQNFNYRSFSFISDIAHTLAITLFVITKIIKKQKIENLLLATTYLAVILSQSLWNSNTRYILSFIPIYIWVGKSKLFYPYFIINIFLTFVYVNLFAAKQWFF